MAELSKNIADHLFGDITTNELTENAYSIKKQEFGTNISFSPKVFIPLTTLCQDSCGYCTFVKSPNQGGTYLNFEEVDAIGKVGDENNCYEALFTLGDKPEKKWEEARIQLKNFGFISTHDYLLENMKRINDKYRLFPHANPGLMTKKEIKDFKNHSPSGGLMLETFSKNVMKRGKPHFNAKTKIIEDRLETINNAEEAKYPITTGLLLGITETKEELIQDIENLILFTRKNKSIQEIILQNFRAKRNTNMKNNPEIINDLFLRIIATVRILLPIHISLQVPPNLIPSIDKFLLSGINDLGGISTKTIDWVNPDHLWPDLNKLQNQIQNSGQFLKPRLPVYPSFINKEWLSEKMFEKVSNVINEDGYPKQYEFAI
jgi:7,8-didemethyl-8-hydroxy-5-deazariboflavin synthase CofG subunit